MLSSLRHVRLIWRVTVVTFGLRRYSLCGRLSSRCQGLSVVVAADDVYVATGELDNFIIFLLKTRFAILRPHGLDASFCMVFAYGHICLSLFSAKSAVLYTTAAWLGASVTAASAHGTSVSADFATVRPQTLGSASKT